LEEKKACISFSIPGNEVQVELDIVIGEKCHSSSGGFGEKGGRTQILKFEGEKMNRKGGGGMLVYVRMEGGMPELQTLNVREIMTEQQGDVKGCIALKRCGVKPIVLRRVDRDVGGGSPKKQGKEIDDRKRKKRRHGFSKRKRRIRKGEKRRAPSKGEGNVHVVPLFQFRGEEKGPVMPGRENKEANHLED